MGSSSPSQGWVARVRDWSLTIMPIKALSRTIKAWIHSATLYVVNKK